MTEIEKQTLVLIKKKAINSLLSDSDKLKYGLFPDGTLDDRGIENLPTDEEINTAYEAKKAEYDAQAYARNRQGDYPDWGSQLNKIYDDGVTKWKSEMVDPVKTKWPKDNSGPIE